MKKVLLFVLAVLLSLFFEVSDSYSSCLQAWDWEFAPSEITVGPTDDIYMYATIYNDASSCDDITKNSFDRKGWGPGVELPYGGYYENIYVDAPWVVLGDSSIAPGESLKFLFTFLEKIGDPTPTGTYHGIHGDITLKSFPEESRDLTVNVVEVPVPEPATMLLLGSGLFGLIGFRRRFRKG